jgi:hypothetical protein
MFLTREWGKIVREAGDQEHTSQRHPEIALAFKASHPPKALRAINSTIRQSP